MQKVLIIYAIIQLMTTAYGLAVIESIRPMVEKKLKDKGYSKNKNSLYTFSSTTTDVLKGLIPFYYLGKALSIISTKDSVDKEVNKKIKSGNYVLSKNDSSVPGIITINDEESEDYTDSIFKSPYDYAFEKPEKYTARKNDNSLYDTYETPVDYIERVSRKEDDLKLTPFNNTSKVVEHVVVKEEVSKSDIAHALSELSIDELTLLRNKINELERIKKENELRLKIAKEVA